MSGQVSERPRLRRGVLLSHDRVRDRPVVLHPEGVLMPNATATAVLELCDGHRDVPTIASTLAERYDGVQEHQIRDLLDRLAAKQVIEWL